MNSNFMLMGWTLMSKEDAEQLIDQMEVTHTETQNISSKTDDDEREASFFAFFDDLSDAEKQIKSMFPVFIVVILVDRKKDKAFVYKGPNVDEIKKVHLPKLFSFYEKAGMGDHPCLESIEDLRILHNPIFPKSFSN